MMMVGILAESVVEVVMVLLAVAPGGGGGDVRI